MSSNIFDKTINALTKSTNMRQLRHDITLSNIANAETPGYKSKVVDFEKSLSRAIELNSATENLGEVGQPEVSSEMIGSVRPDIYDNPEGNVSNDGNSVDLETEMSTLAENSILYKAALKLMTKKLAALKYAVTDGGR